MKFSEAIRLGGVHGPQLFGREFDGDDKTASCAFGGAILASGLTIEPALPGTLSLRGGSPMGSIRVPDHWRVGGVECPSCFHRSFLIAIVQHLNDCHRWTRQEIADFVETIEAREEAKKNVACHQEAAL